MAFDPRTDALGLNLQRRGMDTFLANKEAQRQLDWGPAGSVVDQAAHMTGPLPDPKWQAFFQALADQGVSKVVGGPSPDGSNQLRGISVQPDYFTSGDTFMGRQVVRPPTQGVQGGPYDYVDNGPYSAPATSAAVLKSRARPIPEGHEAFLKRLYGGA